MFTKTKKGSGGADDDAGNQALSRPAHALSPADTVAELSTDPTNGLTDAAAKERLGKYGRNELDEGPGVQPVKIFIRQVANAMMLVLILAMVVSFAIRSWIEGGVVFAVIILNIVVGFIQEFRAEKTMNSLRSLSSPTASVVRESQSKVVPTAELVPGDVTELKTGDTVPADVRLVECSNFETDEALLTGESMPVQKRPDDVFDDDTGPGDRLNMAFSSSTVTKGRALGVVASTGMQTEIGTIAAALRANKSALPPLKRTPEGRVQRRWIPQAVVLMAAHFAGNFLGVNVGTPLHRKLSKLALLLFGIAIICAIIVEASNNFSDRTEVIIYAVATGLSMIPASLVVVLTITMAAGTRRMVERNVIVRRLDSLEALGGVTDICSDKTGTLTQGKMVAKKAWVPGKGTYSVGQSGEPFNPTVGELSFRDKSPTEIDLKTMEDDDGVPHTQLLENNNRLKGFLDAASLANLAKVHTDDKGEWHARGDPTEIAIEVFAYRFDWYREKWTKGDSPKWAHVAEFPFDSDVKRMSVIYTKKRDGDGSQTIFVKGAVERVLDICSGVVLDEAGDAVELTSEFRDRVSKSVETLSAEGLRVLAMARKRLDQVVDGNREDLRREDYERDLNFLGLIGLYDPPRPESEGAVRACHRAGVSVHMLTGDHPGTARSIASQVGILPSKMNMVSRVAAESMVMTASQFDKLSEDEIDRLPVLPLVIARCAPQTKVRMVEALHRRGLFAAMTGDGVNDSPSLKRADVGIAMGQAGSDVAKDASDIVLTDDNFASILNAVEEGRRMFDNIQKFVLHLLAQNIAQAGTLLIGLSFKDSTGLSVFPLAPVEILWVIMVTSGVPDMGLGFEVAQPDILDRPPQNLRRGVFTFEVMLDMLVYGFWMTSLCLAAFTMVTWYWGDGNLGSNCNNAYSPECDLVFRARATTFVCMTWFSLFLAWEMVNLRRSFFRMQPKSKRYLTQWMLDVWRNKFLFWSIIAGFVTVFPTLYIPVINHDVFKHEGISWEWGIVMVEGVLFVSGVESWKWAKRVFFRRRQAKMGGKGKLDEEEIESKVFGNYLSDSPSDERDMSGKPLPSSSEKEQQNGTNGTKGKKSRFFGKSQ